MSRPENWKATDKRPALLFLHGGGWVGGKPGQFSQHAAFLARRGMICFQVEYRLLDRKKNLPPKICVEDALAAMDWVKKNSVSQGVDSDRIGAAGGSAGGHLAAYLGMIAPAQQKPATLLLFNPVYDNGPGAWGHKRVGEDYLLWSPLHNITKDDPSSLVFFGTQDALVSVETAKDFQQRCKNAGLSSELVLFENQGHGFFNTNRQGGKWFRETIMSCEKWLVGLKWIAPATTN